MRGSTRRRWTRPSTTAQWLNRTKKCRNPSRRFLDIGFYIENYLSLRGMGSQHRPGRCCWRCCGKRTDWGRRNMSRMRGGVLASVGAVALACFIVIGAGAASHPSRAKSKFTKQDRQILARQVARGEHTASLLVATPRYGTKAVAQKVPRAGRLDRLPQRQARLHPGERPDAQGRRGLEAERDPDDQRRHDAAAHGSIAGRLAGSDPAAAARRGHAAGQSVSAHARYRGGAVRERTSDMGRPGHHDRHPRHRSRSRPPERQRHEHGPAQDRRLGHLHGSVDGRRPDVAAGGRHRERRRRRIHRVRHCVHRGSRGRHVQVRAHARGSARRGERVRHRLRRRPQP